MKKLLYIGGDYAIDITDSCIYKKLGMKNCPVFFSKNKGHDVKK
jgi:hypothetical protein